MKSTRELETKIRNFAKNHNYVVKESELERVIKGLRRNFERYDLYFCPCKRYLPDPDDPDWNAINECPCQSVHDDIHKNGHCYCRLFWTREALEQGKH